MKLFLLVFLTAVLGACSSVPQTESSHPVKANEKPVLLSGEQKSALTFEGAIQTKRTEVTKCYKLYGNLQPGVQVSYDFTLRYNGEIQKLEVNEAKSKGGNSALKICILNQLKQIQYPEVVGYDRAFYNYTFHF